MGTKRQCTLFKISTTDRGEYSGGMQDKKMTDFFLSEHTTQDKRTVLRRNSRSPPFHWQTRSFVEHLQGSILFCWPLTWSIGMCNVFRCLMRTPSKNVWTASGEVICTFSSLPGTTFFLFGAMQAPHYNIAPQQTTHSAQLNCAVIGYKHNSIPRVQVRLFGQLHFLLKSQKIYGRQFE